MGIRSLAVFACFVSWGASAQLTESLALTHEEEAALNKQEKLDAEYDNSERKRSHKIPPYAAEFCEAATLSKISALLYAVRMPPLQSWTEEKKKAFVEDELASTLALKKDRYVSARVQLAGNVRWALFTVEEGGKTRVLRVKLHDDPKNGVYKSQRDSTTNDLIRVEELQTENNNGAPEIPCAENTYQLKSIPSRLEQLQQKAKNFVPLSEVMTTYRSGMTDHREEKTSLPAQAKAQTSPQPHAQAAAAAPVHAPAPLPTPAAKPTSVPAPKATAVSAPKPTPAPTPNAAPVPAPTPKNKNEQSPEFYTAFPEISPHAVTKEQKAVNSYREKELRDRYCGAALTKAAREVLDTVMSNKAFRQTTKLRGLEKEVRLQALNDALASALEGNTLGSGVRIAFDGHLRMRLSQNIGDSMKNALTPNHRVGLYKSGASWQEIGDRRGFEICVDYKDVNGQDDITQTEHVRYTISPTGQFETEVFYIGAGGYNQTVRPCQK